MGLGNYGFNDAVLSPPSIDIDLAPTKRERERIQLLQETIRTVNIFTHQAGRELPIIPISEAEDIGNEPGVYILSSHPERPVEDATFTLRRDLLSGTRDSAHCVVTGQIDIKRDGYAEPQTKQVAVKCFSKRDEEDRKRRAIQEFKVMHELYEAGDVAFKPVCLIVDDRDGPSKGNVAILTSFDPGIFSLDNFAWRRGNGESADMAGSAAAALGRYNSLYGLVHKDAQIKNVAQREDGQFGMIDHETSEYMDAFNPQQAQRAAHVDFQKLVDSLDKRGLFDVPVSEKPKLVTYLADCYLDQWQDKPVEVQSAVLESVSDVVSKTISS